MFTANQLMGMGAGLSATQAQAIAKKANQALAGQIATRAQKYMLLKQALLSPNIQAIIKAGSVKFTNESYFFRVLIGTALNGAIVFNTGTVVATNGLTNLQNGKIVANSAAVITEVGVKVALPGSSLTDPSLTTYTNMDASIPAALQNAELTIKIKGQPLPMMPLKDFFAFGDTVVSNGLGRDKVTLQSPILLNETDTIDAQIQFPPNNATALAHAGFIELSLYGCGIRIGA